MLVDGVADDLHRLVANLIENALVHTPAGTPVTVATRVEDAAAVLEVVRSRPRCGPGHARRGCSSASRARAATSAQRSGSGLGLAIVRAVAEAHGGTVALDDAEGGGARFVVRLPLSPRIGPPAEAPRRPRASALSAPSVPLACSRPGRPRQPEHSHPMRLARLRPSPALVISMIALFLSLGGVSYGVATGFIDSREIKNNTVASGDLRNNEIRTKDLRNNEIRGLDIRNSTIQGRDVALATITGDDVRESTLDEVPSAARAATAGSADAVTSLKLVARTALNAGAPPVTLATEGPLTVTAACLTGGTGPEAADPRAASVAGADAAGTATATAFGPGDGPQPIAELPSTGARVASALPVTASAPGARSLSGVMGLTADGAGPGTCSFPRTPRAFLAALALASAPGLACGGEDTARDPSRRRS